MIKKFIMGLLVVFAIGNLVQAKEAPGYIYTVDLTKISDDQLQVQLQTPKIAENEITFYLPKIIPGTYSIADYGRMVSNLKAFDKKGKPLEIKRIDDNSWQILNAKKLKSITYTIEDTFDSTLEGPDIFQPAGTNFEAGENFIINPSGFFGYFEGMKDLPIEFNIIRDPSFYGGTGLIPTAPKLQAKISLESSASSTVVDTYVVENYDRLIDSPLMYAKADTARIQVANTEVIISSYSPNKMVSAKEIATTIEETLMAQKDYLGGKLPVDKYAFIFYFTDQPVTSYGALEHSYSSLYYMPEMALEEMEQQLRDFAAHEFFHIVTPLTVHSQEIHKFDFNDPKMSKHLWLYEGVTEYFAGNVQVQFDLISKEEYLDMLREKIIYSKQNLNDTLAFTELSKHTLDQYSDQYYNVYQKGALIGMCLDIELRSLSSGTYSLPQLLKELSEKYGKDKGFDDEALFGVITELTYPEIGTFFKTYVEKGNPIPYDVYLQKAGVQYKEEMEVKLLTFGLENGAVSVDPETKKLVIVNTDALNEFGKTLGFKKGDLLTSMGGQEIPPLGPKIPPFIESVIENLKEGEDFVYGIERKNEAGEYESVELKSKNFKIVQKQRHVLALEENPTDAQLQLRKNWLER